MTQHTAPAFEPRTEPTLLTRCQNPQTLFGGLATSAARLFELAIGNRADDRFVSEWFINICHGPGYTMCCIR